MHTWKVLLELFLNTTNREKLSFTQFSTRVFWNRSLAPSELFHMFTQSIEVWAISHVYPIIWVLYIPLLRKSTDVWEIAFIKQTKNERLFLSATFTAKIVLVFALTQGRAFSYRFNFKANRKSIASSKKRYYRFSK